MTCTLDCLSTYGCGTPLEASPGAIFSPYIRLEFGGETITVGNNSSTIDNHAAISSFQYGFGTGTTGYGADFEIIDDGGVTSRKIIRAINKTISQSNKETLGTVFDFGWIIKDCFGEISLQTAYTMTGRKLHGMFTGLEQTYEGGKSKIKFRLEGPQHNIPEVRHDDTEGDESQKISLKTALTELFTENNPKFTNVLFLNKDGGELQFKNSDGGDDGPLGAWPINQQNPLAAARTWLSSIPTSNDRGILICYDPDTSSIIFQEDKTEKGCCSNTMGTYVVNGGNCSPVLEFNPTIKWPFGFIPGAGATTGGSSSGDNSKYVEPTIDVQKAGTQTNPSIQQHEWGFRHPDDQAQSASEGNAAHMEANKNYEHIPGFSAELKIHGDPGYIDPFFLIGKTISIIVINPFHLDNQCVWITKPNCNPVLSNKKWNIQGVSHQITGGSFITTLKVYLTQPNKDIDASDALGGNGCGSETFYDDIGGSFADDANE
jgi:hypothetical protein